jgi:leucyl aminopeptidase
LFANDDELSAQIIAASEKAGEATWRMPLADDFRKDLDSDVADMKNSGPRWGSAIVGAIFLKQHVDGSIPWAHLDIAGTDWADKPHELGPKGPTGVMTRTLITWLESRGS